MPPKNEKGVPVLERLCGKRMLHRSIERRTGRGEGSVRALVPA